MDRQPTLWVRTGMPTLRKSLGHTPSTSRAILRRKGRVYFEESASGTLSLVRSAYSKHGPGSIRNALIETSLPTGSVGEIVARVVGVWLWLGSSHHVFDRQLLQRNQVIAVDQF